MLLCLVVFLLLVHPEANWLVFFPSCVSHRMLEHTSFFAFAACFFDICFWFILKQPDGISKRCFTSYVEAYNICPLLLLPSVVLLLVHPEAQWLVFFQVAFHIVCWSIHHLLPSFTSFLFELSFHSCFFFPTPTQILLYIIISIACGGLAWQKCVHHNKHKGSEN